MAHLDDDVAAFVDGQLSPAATEAVERHLQGCERCRHAVEDQRRLKQRMRLAGEPGIPAGLAAQLAGLPARPPTPRRPWWARLARSGAASASVVLVGASLAVIVTAYAAGSSERRAAADPVVPPFASYVDDFQGRSSAQDTMTVAAMASLDEQGWPCHSRLGADLERVDGRWHEGSSDTLAITYSDGERRLGLFEQNGRLDLDRLHGFRRVLVDQRPVWERPGSPRVLTWDADGVVYTVVTDVAQPELVDALRLLPRAAEPRTPVERVEDGMRRMSGWIGAA
ncbi:MAG: zf-HC2 domain-containing protein [Aeromicrobium erythreum]